jgi:DNA adenine methylase
MRGESIKGIIDFLKANPAYADPTIRFSAAEWRAIEKEIPQVLELNLSDNPDDPYLTEGEDAEEEEMPDDLEGEGRAAKTMRPPICRVGTKASILDKVFKAFPDDSAYDTYVEPFIGGGAVYWAKDPTKREVINDLDSELIELYRTLKTTRSRDVPTDLTSKAAIQSFFDKGKPPGDMRKLAYGIVASCNRWMGRQTGNIIYKESDPAKKLRKLDEYQERMKGTTILNESYEKVLRRFDSPRTFFYLDPPYEDSKTLYKAIEKTGFDFEKLRDELSRLKGKWLLSINDSKYIRDLFKGFYARGFVQKARGKGLGSIGNKDRKELLIANYAF